MSLEIRGVGIELGHRPILSDIDVHVDAGELVGLLGPNGSGKSTLLKCLYRVHRPDVGAILLDGQDLLRMRPRQAASRLAVVMQDSPLEFDASVTEVVMVGRNPHQGAFSRVAAADLDAVRSALESVDLLTAQTRSVATLSGGERQRVFIARALAQGCDHLLLDEPTNHLDIRHQVDVLELVHRQCLRGVTVLAALHDLSLAGQYCDRIYLLHHGRVVAEGIPDEVITAELVREVYGADVLVQPHPETGRPQVVPRRAQHDHTLEERP